MTNEACYEIVVEECTLLCLVIRDVGPHDQFKTITNAAEWVVADLFRRGFLAINQRLEYYDSEGEMTEILVSPEGTFDGFPPIQRGGGETCTA